MAHTPKAQPARRLLAAVRRPTPRAAAATAVVTLLVLVGCERGRQTSPADSAAPTVAAGTPSAAPAPAASTWESSAGPVLAVAGESPGEAVVIFPQYTDSTLSDTTSFDLSTVRGTSFDLFSRAGSAGTATLRPQAGEERADQGCVAWPTMAVAPAQGGSLPAWTVAFASGHAETMPLDSIEALPRADSARLAVEAARLASSLPSDTARAFRGIPFFVRTVRRFTIPPGTNALVADVVRRVNQEASPREEQILIVAERDSTQPPGRYTVAYFERSAGLEETVEATDVLAALLVGDARRPTLVLSRDDGDGVSYALLERMGPRTWRVRWTSAYAGC